MVNHPPANAGDIRDMGSTPGSGRSPGGGHGNPLQFSCLENPHKQRSLTGYSPYDLKELDTTEAATHAYNQGADSSKFFLPQHANSCENCPHQLPSSLFYIYETNLYQPICVCTCFFNSPFSPLYHFNSLLMKESNKIFDPCSFFICMSHDFTC